MNSFALAIILTPSVSQIATSLPTTSGSRWISESEPVTSDLDIHTRCACLVRWASPVRSAQKPSPTSSCPWGTVSRPLNLVRRVTMAAEMERRRKRARNETRRIVKKILALAVRLQRKHRDLKIWVLSHQELGAVIRETPLGLPTLTS
ncbi:hypothetical protein B0H10DRAFT_1946805 [Mycena sp. CBHHK59/15]|nr:hypothetical protein B0H10DRAFT_1946805 [Mycena sp. CBHHK59/15]